MMKYRKITGALALAFTLLTFTSGAHAEKSPEPAPKTVPAATPAPEPVKNLTKADYQKLRAAREKASEDASVKAAEAKDKAAHTAHLAAKKSGDAEAAKTTAKAAEEAHDEFAKIRREVIAKTDPDAAKLDERAFAVGERLHKAREAKPAKEKPAGN